MPRHVRQSCHEWCHSVKLSDSTMNKVKWHVVSGIVAVMLAAIAIWSIKSFPRSDQERECVADVVTPDTPAVPHDTPAKDVEAMIAEMPEVFRRGGLDAEVQNGAIIRGIWAETNLGRRNEFIKEYSKVLTTLSFSDVKFPQRAHMLANHWRIVHNLSEAMARLGCPCEQIVDFVIATACRYRDEWNACEKAVLHMNDGEMHVLKPSEIKHGHPRGAFARSGMTPKGELQSHMRQLKLTQHNVLRWVRWFLTERFMKQASLLERAPAAERQRIEKKLETAFKELDVEPRK